MKKRLLSVILALVILLAGGGAALAAIAYSVPITVTENGTASYDMVACNVTANVDYMANNGIFAGIEGLDTRVLIGTTPQKHMLADDKIMFATPMSISSTKTLSFTTGSANLSSFPIIVGYSANTSVGFVTTTDNATLELSDNFTVQQTGWVTTLFTDNYTGRNLALKSDAFATFVASSGNITSEIPGRNVLDFVPGNSDWVEVADHADFSMVSAPGVDIPFSITSWVKFDDVTNSGIVTKTGAAFEWGFQVTFDKLIGWVLSPAGLAYAGRETDVVTAYEGVWTHFAMTYDGSETSAGVNIYINGVDSDTGDFELGVYAGMTGGVEKVSIGAAEEGTVNFMDGSMAEVKVYRDRCLTPAEVVNSYNGAVDTASLVGYWKFDEGAGNPADSSGLGHNGTNNGADWVVGLMPAGRNLGGLSVSTGGVESSNHTIKTTADTVNLKLFVDDMVVAKDTVALGGLSVPDTDGAWAFLQNNVMPYADNITISIDGTEVLRYEPIAYIRGTNLPDLAGSSQNGTIIWGSNPSGIAISLGVMISDYEPYSAPGAADAQDIVPELTPPLIASDIVRRALLDDDPFIELAVAIEDVTEDRLPVLLQYWAVYILISIILFIVVYRYIPNLLIAGIIFCVPIGFGISQGFFDFWVIAALILWLIGCAMFEGRRIFG